MSSIRRQFQITFVTGLLVISPVIGGGILQLTSYNVLFAIALSAYVIALFAASRLPKLSKTSEISEISEVSAERAE